MRTCETYQGGSLFLANEALREALPVLDVVRRTAADAGDIFGRELPDHLSRRTDHEAAGRDLLPFADEGAGADQATRADLGAIEDNRADAKTGYGMIVGGVIYEDLLPETITSYKTELETNGTSWVWETYSDSREV